MFAKQHSRSPRTSRLRLELLEPRLLLSGGDFLESQALGTVESPDINEASGMVASRQNADVIWVHNDSGDMARIFAMNTSGDHLGVYNIDGAIADDWEDIAIGPCFDPNEDCLYIADIGDNAGERSSITVYRVPEPVVAANQDPLEFTLAGAEAIVLQYPGGGRDAESLMIDPLSGDLYIISKRETPSHLYFAAASSLFGGETVALEDLGPLESTFASAADISPDGSEMLVRYYNAQTDTESVLLYDRPSDTSVAAALFAGGVQVPYELEPNGEAVSFNADASGYFTTSEQLHQSINFYERVGESVSIERSTDVPVNIRSNKTITSTITVDQSQTIADLEVQLAIDHSRIGDLDIELIGPGGETVVLATGRGGSNADYPNTIFDDDAAEPITGSTAPFIGRFQPEGKLSDFGGTDARGTWTLRVRDTRKGVNGKLTFWSLVITPENLTAPALSISDASIVEGDVGETTSAMFTVTLANPPVTNVTVDFSTADGTATAVEDYVATNGTLTFTGGQTTQTIIVDVLGDTIYEGNETFLVTLSNADGAQINGASATGTIVENDPAPTSVTIDNVTVTEGETAVFTVTLQNPPSGGSVVVNYSTSDGTATADLDYYGITGGTLTFDLDAEPDVLSKTISVLTIVDSIKREGNENFSVELTSPNSPPAVGIGTIKDAKGGGGGNGGNGGGPKKNATSVTSTDLTDAAFDSFAGQDDAPQATSSPLFDRRGSSGGSEESEESDDEALLLSSPR